MTTAPDAARRFADALLPGGAGFPAFSATGAEATLLARLTPAQRARLGDDPARMEADDPAGFAELRKQVYLAYYETAAAIAAIRAAGHPYNDAPLPDGYPAERWDPARDAPRHRRGHWIDTDEVCRVDLSGLGLPA